MEKNKTFSFIPMKIQFKCKLIKDYKNLERAIDNRKDVGEDYIFLNEIELLSKVESMLKKAYANICSTNNANKITTDEMRKKIFDRVDSKLWADKNFILEMTPYSPAVLERADKKFF